MGHTQHLFHLFSSFSYSSNIQTRIFGVKSRDADHCTTTTTALLNIAVSKLNVLIPWINVSESNPPHSCSIGILLIEPSQKRGIRLLRWSRM